MTAPRALSPADIDAYRRDGWVIVKEILDPADVSACIEESERLWAHVDVDRADPRIQFRSHLDGGEIMDRIDPLLDVSPFYEALAADPRLTAAVSSLLDGTPIPFKAKLITKRPGTAGYGLHQDYPYWEWLGLAADEYVNATIAFDPFDGSNGTLEFFPGLHRERIPAPSESPFDADESFLQGRPSLLLELAPGDAVLFHSMVPHRSGPNRGTHSRRGIFLTYFSSRHQGLKERYERGRVDRPK